MGSLASGDTIAAIATPAGSGAVAIIRVSGPGALRIVDQVFRGRASLQEAAGFTVHHGHIVGREGEAVDEVLATVFRAPRSYTGEDVVEVGCHGGMLVTASVLDAVVGAGARPADPGEFTRRAFLNGRMDLTQAEAVADLIAARSRRGQRASLEQLHGRLGERVRELRKTLLDLCALLEIDLDFAEEGLEIIPPDEIDKQLNEAAALAKRMLDTYESGRLFRDGISVVLAGSPNAGKSSLFNALLETERAIVNPLPGTTRDFLEESISYEGFTMRLFDTAGLRKTLDDVERAGVRMSETVVKSADIILLVVDGSCGFSKSDALAELGAVSADQTVISVLNKSDLLLSIAPEGLRIRRDLEDWDVRVSAKTGEGLTMLKRAILSGATHGVGIGDSDLVVTSKRHREALHHAYQGLGEARRALANKATNEFVAFDVKEAATALAEITGEVTSEDILNTIFSRFCIGK